MQEEKDLKCKNKKKKYQKPKRTSEEVFETLALDCCGWGGGKWPDGIVSS